MFEETLRTRQTGSRGTRAYKVIWNRTAWFEEPFTRETNQYLQELVNLRKKCSEGKGKTQDQHEDWLGRAGIVESILGEWHYLNTNDWNCQCEKYCSEVIG